MVDVAGGGLMSRYRVYSVYNYPFYNPIGGGLWSYSPYISLDRSQSQYFNAGAQTFKVSTNGGFTALMYAAFTGTAGNNERIFDFGGVSLLREGSLTNMIVTLPVGFNIKASSVIIQGEWALFTVRYKASTKFLELFKNGILVASGTSPTALSDFSATYTYIGRGNTATDAYFNGQIAGFYLYDRFLTDGLVEILSNQLSEYFLIGEYIL
jgi:hypothetical protein